MRDLFLHRDTLQAYEILPVPYPVMSWVVPMPQHTPTHFRIDDSKSLNPSPSSFTRPLPLAMSLRAHPDELMLGQMRDWNDELQTAKELSTTTSSAKVFRDRALFKVRVTPPLMSCDVLTPPPRSIPSLCRRAHVVLRQWSRVTSHHLTLEKSLSKHT